MQINTEPTTDDLPADQYDYATVRDLHFADIDMPDDFEAQIHVLESGAEVTVCGDDVGCRSVQDLEPEQFDELDCDAREWATAREDFCPACEESFLDATEGNR